MPSGSTSARLYSPEEPLELIGTSPAISRIREEVAEAARCEAKVLITGESGTGKEVIARRIHHESRRRQQELVTLNCGAVAESLLESELFGHARGSFTGADRERVGHLERAHRGTVFLDEIGEMSPRMQGALLRFLETGEVQQVGADRACTRVDVRLIAATNRDLAESIARKEFREDLFYRLNVYHIVAPALRDRREDIPGLISYFTDLFSRRHGLPRPHFSADALSAFTRYAWPGNIRELRNIVERVVIYSTQQSVGEGNLPKELRQPASCRDERAGVVTRADELLARLRNRNESFWSAAYAPFMARDLTRHDIRYVITRGLTETRGNYRCLVPLFNMPTNDYKRFLNFLKKHGCHVAFQPFRGLDAAATLAEEAA